MNLEKIASISVTFAKAPRATDFWESSVGKSGFCDEKAGHQSEFSSEFREV
jgi:hypothetical protein